MSKLWGAITLLFVTLAMLVAVYTFASFQADKQCRAYGWAAGGLSGFTSVCYQDGYAKALEEVIHPKVKAVTF